MTVHDLSPSAESAFICIIDDDDAFRRSLVFLLEDVGWQVQAYPSATKFLAANPTPSQHTGCIISDIRMPMMSGLELQQILHKNGWQLPFILITGHGDIELAVEAMKNGAFDFLSKPFREQVLLDTVAAALRFSQATQEDVSRAQNAKERLEQLSPRESEVAYLIAKGYPNKRIALALEISEKTVHIHRQNVMGKLKISNAADLTRIILRADPKALD